jgi:hypothetical protein
MKLSPVHVAPIERFNEFRDVARGYIALQTEVTWEIRRIFDTAAELRLELREVGLHGHELALQILVLMASEQPGGFRDVLAETADKLVDLDRRQLEAAAS